MYRLIGVLLLGCTAALVVLNADRFEYQFGTIKDRFRIDMLTDLRKLKEKKKINKAFFKPRKIVYNAHTPLTKALIYRSRPLTGSDPKNPYRLEIDMHEWEDGGELGVTVTYNIYDAKTDNKVNEFGRTYILLNPKKPQGKPKGRS